MCMVLQFMRKKDFLLHETYLQKTPQILTYVFDWLYFTLCLPSFSSFDHFFCLYAQFLILFHLDQTDFNIHLKDWLTYSDRTDRPDVLCYNFSISNDLAQMVNFPTQIPD